MNISNDSITQIEFDINSITDHFIFKFKDLWSEIGEIQFETIIEHHVNRIYITALDVSEKNRSNYLKEQIKIFEGNYQGIKILEFYRKFVENTVETNDTFLQDMNKNEFLSWLSKKKDEISAKSKDAFKSYKILSHNLNKKNYEEINAAEKSFFRKEILLKSAMNKTYETLLLYHMAYLKLETYNYLLLQFDNISNKASKIS